VKKVSITALADVATTEIDGSAFIYTAAWHYILARMLSGDRHAGSSDSTASVHYKLFFEMLGVAMRQEDLLENPK
jgi:hypothetical protein